MILSSTTKMCLEQAGWHKERSYDISLYLQHLEKEGYHICEHAKVFMKEFGGLKVIHPNMKDARSMDYFIVDPTVFGDYTMDAINGYEVRTKERLTPVGEASRGYLIMMISESGKVYVAYDSFLLKIGDSGYEAIATLCDGIERNLVEIK